MVGPVMSDGSVAGANSKTAGRCHAVWVKSGAELVLPAAAAAAATAAAGEAAAA